MASSAAAQSHASSSTYSASRASLLCALLALLESVVINVIFGSQGLSGMLLAPLGAFLVTQPSAGDVVASACAVCIGVPIMTVQSAAFTYLAYLLGGLRWRPWLVGLFMPFIAALVTSMSFVALKRFVGKPGAAVFFAPPYAIAFFAVLVPTTMLGATGHGRLEEPAIVAAYIGIALATGGALALAAAILPMPHTTTVVDSTTYEGTSTSAMRLMMSSPTRRPSFFRWVLCRVTHLTQSLISIGAQRARILVPRAAAMEMFSLARCVEAVGTWRSSLSTGSAGATDVAILRSRHLAAIRATFDWISAREKEKRELGIFSSSSTRCGRRCNSTSSSNNNNLRWCEPCAEATRNVVKSSESCRLAFSMLHLSIMHSKAPRQLLQRDDDDNELEAYNPYDAYRTPIVKAVSRALRSAGGLCAQAAGQAGVAASHFGGHEEVRLAGHAARAAAARLEKAMNSGETELPSLFRDALKRIGSNLDIHDVAARHAAFYQGCRSRAEQLALMLAAESAGDLCDAVIHAVTDDEEPPLTDKARGVGIGVVTYVTSPFAGVAAWRNAIGHKELAHIGRLVLIAGLFAALGGGVPQMWRGGAHGIWALFTAGFSLQANLGASLTKSIGRVSGTLIGCLLGWASAAIAPGQPLALSFHILIIVFVLKYFEAEYLGSASAFAMLGFLIVLGGAGFGELDFGSGGFTLQARAQQPSNSFRVNAVAIGEYRIVEVLIGVAAAVLASILVCPERASDLLRERMALGFEHVAEALASSCAYLATSLTPPPVQPLADARRRRRRGEEEGLNDEGGSDDNNNDVKVLMEPNTTVRKLLELRECIWIEESTLMQGEVIEDSATEARFGLGEPMSCLRQSELAPTSGCLVAFRPTVLLLRRANNLLALLSHIQHDEEVRPAFASQKTIHALETLSSSLHRACLNARARLVSSSPSTLKLGGVMECSSTSQHTSPTEDAFKTFVDAAIETAERHALDSVPLGATTLHHAASVFVLCECIHALDAANKALQVKKKTSSFRRCQEEDEHELIWSEWETRAT